MNSRPDVIQLFFQGPKCRNYNVNVSSVTTKGLSIPEPLHDSFRKPVHRSSYRLDVGADLDQRLFGLSTEPDQILIGSIDLLCEGHFPRPGPKLKLPKGSHEVIELPPGKGQYSTSGTDITEHLFEGFNVTTYFIMQLL